MTTSFDLPNEALISEISSTYPCRENQIRTLLTLISICGAPSQNIVLHGLEATGKTAVTKAVLEKLSNSHLGHGHKNDLKTDTTSYAMVKSAECINGRHLLEQTVESVAEAVKCKRTPGSIGNLSELTVELQRLLEEWTVGETGKRRFVLVFDGIDKQRDAPPTLVPALARMAEMTLDLTLVFIITCPRPSFLHLLGAPHIPFPPYTRAELLRIISLTTPSPALSSPEDTTQTWSSYTTAVYDSLSKHSGRDLFSFRALCLRLWPLFIRPILTDELEPHQFSRLMVANRSLFQSESILVHNMVSSEAQALTRLSQKHSNISILLPNFSRLLLVASYLASFNPARNDALLFIKATAAKRRNKGGGTALTSSRPGASKSRKISRKLLGAQPFVLERMLAIFHAIRPDSRSTDGREIGNGWHRSAVNGSADELMGVATLMSLRLILRMGNLDTGDVLEASNKYRVTVGFEIARSVARSVGVEMEDYLID